MNSISRTLLWAVPGAITGFIAWNAGSMYGFALLPIVAYLWARSKTRPAAFCTLYAYYLAAAWCQLPSISTFWRPLDGSPAYGAAIAVWLGANALLSLVWAMAWGKKYRAIRLLVVLLVLSLPPIGVIGWASPLTGAGIWYPDMRWYGLGLFIALLAFLASPRGVISYIAMGVLCLVAVLANIYTPPPPSSAGWIGVDTHFGSISDFAGEFDRLLQVDQAARSAIRAGGSTDIVLPEAVGGNWPISKNLFSMLDRAAARRHITVFIGAREYDSQGRLVNAVYSIGQYAGRRWVNRVPVPAGLWKPWANKGSAVSDWWNSGVQDIGRTRVGSLICYEQLLVWPVLFSTAAGVDVLIAPSSTWFGDNTPLPSIKASTSQAWGRLFGIPVVPAVNN
jgi:hypothetical protein